MLSFDMRHRFYEYYQGNLDDPVINIVLDTLDAFQKEVHEKLLLTTYSQWNEGNTDGLFESLRRHLFGQMFPGPAFVIVHATLRNANESQCLKIDKYFPFSVQDSEGNQHLFSPQSPSWIVPSSTNDILVETNGDTLILNLNVFHANIEDTDGEINIYCGGVDPYLIERMRCRIYQMSGYSGAAAEPEMPFRSAYPGMYQIRKDFFQTPYHNKFLKVPFSLIRKIALADGNGPKATVNLPFSGMARHANDLARKLTMNAFVMWNIIEKENLLRRTADGLTFTLQSLSLNKNRVMINSVQDTGIDPPPEYLDSSAVLDPSYHYQYITESDKDNDSITLRLHPKPKGDIKVYYSIYDLDPKCRNIQAGSAFSFYRGLDDSIRSVHSLTPSGGNESINDKDKIWEYFRSMLSSRTRLLTKEDLRTAIANYPAFASRPDIVDPNQIEFNEKVGRVSGFITPYTEIKVFFGDQDIIDNDGERTFFEREIGLYLKNKTVNGNYLQVRLMEIDKHRKQF